MLREPDVVRRHGDGRWLIESRLRRHAGFRRDGVCDEPLPAPGADFGREDAVERARRQPARIWTDGVERE